MRSVVQLCLAANNILLMRKWNHASRSFPKQKYRDLSRRSIDLLATDKSRYFAQPRSIIANSLFIYPRNTKDLWFSFCSLFQQKLCGNKNEFNWILQGEVDIHNFVFIFYLEKFKVFFVVVARFSVAKLWPAWPMVERLTEHRKLCFSS